jgi:hypothetical protein
MRVTKIKPTPNQQDSPQNNHHFMELLSEYCKDIKEWSARWEIVEADLKIGQAITEQFKLFLIDRIQKGRAKRTIKIYANYLWALGGELIRQINEDDSQRRLSAKELILKYIDDSGGPYWRHAQDELEHDRYDSVCKLLFKFITANSN